MLRGQRLAIAARRSFADLASQAVATVAVFGTFAYIAWRTIQGAISLGDMMKYYHAFNTGLGALQSLLGGVAGLYEDNLFLTYYHDFMQLEPRVVDPPLRGRCRGRCARASSSRASTSTTLTRSARRCRRSTCTSGRAR